MDPFTRAGVVAAQVLSIFVGATGLAAAQVASSAVPEASSLPLMSLSASLQENYPTLRALVIARGNCVAFEHYGRNVGMETQSPMYSVTKSVLSILVGIAIDEGHLRPDQKLFEIFPEEFDEFTDLRARDITVRDVLTKTEGFAETSEGNFRVGVGISGTPQVWRWMLNRAVKYPRGTHFRYDGVGSDLLAVVLSCAIKQRAADFAKQKLFDPLHIDNYNWYSDSEGYLHGESGLHLTARDMTKIGMLYLQRGRWEGKQIVSASYVKDSVSPHNGGGPPVNVAYGYQWWTNKTASGLDAFFASGKGSQLIAVIPQQDLVIAIAAAESIPGGVRKFMNEVVLPAATRLPGDSPCIIQYGRPNSAN